MLAGLSIRDFVLIDRLDLRFHDGLGVLTGETGAGKSILLEALGLALGGRASPTLLRAQAKQGSVAAEFHLGPADAAHAFLAEAGLPAAGDRLILRRTFAADGKSRAFVNDEPTSVLLVQRLGESLIEIQGQFEDRGLLNPVTHREALDSFGDYAAEVQATARAFDAWKEAERTLLEAKAENERTARREDELRHHLEELDRLDPREDEETVLGETRDLLRHGEQLGEALNQATAALAGEPDVETALAHARKALARQATAAKGRFDPILKSLEAASLELAEALGALAHLAGDFEADPTRLEEVEGRLFALRACARKHGLPVAELPHFREALKAKLRSVEVATEDLRKSEARLAELRETYRKAATTLRKARASASLRLDQAIQAELGPLKLEKAVFKTQLTPLEEAQWARHGTDRITFEGTMNPGGTPGPLAKIASGGELSRLMLALKVVLSQANPVPTLVFDEVDRGIGGAVATAVGERLARLGNDVQVLVVTHSPQVAALGAHHWRVRKSETAQGVIAHVEELPQAARREEIARMLAGARVTEEARAAADQLLLAHKT